LKILEVNMVSLKRYFIPSQCGRLLVRVKTDEGFYGYGESGEDSRWGIGERLLKNWAKAILIGSNPPEINKILRKIWISMKHFGRSAIMMGTYAALDFALHDLKARILGVPVYELLGGKFRDKIRVYCDTGRPSFENPESHLNFIKKVKEEGFTAIKFDLDLSPQRREARGWEPFNDHVRNDELKWMRHVTEIIRDFVGDDMELMVDLHGSFNVTSAIKIAKALEPYNLTWLEEPVPAENVDAMREVKISTSTPICSGENLYSTWEFRRLLEKQAVDVIEPDISKCGGISEGKRISEMADLRYIPVAPHNTSTSIGTIAASHLCASIPNFLSLEWHAGKPPREDPRYADWNLICWDGPIIKDGHITLSEKPGFGFELDEKKCLEWNPETEVLFR